MTGSTFFGMMTMIRILRDFKPILDLDLYGEPMPEERITGSSNTRCMASIILSINKLRPVKAIAGFPHILVNLEINKLIFQVLGNVCYNMAGLHDLKK